MTPRSLHNKKHSARSGFTLVEFIVIMAIFSVMVGVVLFNFTGFRSKITLDNLAQDIALSIRQIQASAGATLSNPSEPQDEIPRGIYFPTDGGLYTKSFVLFQDNNRSDAYEEGEDVLIDTITIQAPDTINDIYYGDTIDNAENSIGHNPFAITFKRYKTDAIFNDPELLTSTAGVIRIEILSVDRSQARYVTVSRLGQVSVQSVGLDATGTPPTIPQADPDPTL